MKMQSIEIAVRSRRDRAARVRFERSPAIPAGTITLVVVGGDLVVSCGTSAVVDSVGSTLLDGNLGIVPDLLLRDGELELAVCCRSSDGPALAAVPVDDSPTRNASGHAQALTVRDAEWTPGEDEPAPTLVDPSPPVSQPRVVPFPAPATRRGGRDPVWDMPTRFQPVVQPLADRPRPPAAEEQTGGRRQPSPEGAPSRRRVMIRRVALLSMLLCAFVLMMRTRRARDARSVAPAASSVAAAASGAAAGSARAQRSPAARVPPPPDTWDDPVPARLPAPGPSASNAPSSVAALVPDNAPTTANPRKGPAITKARRAADALANGSYAEALRLYDELRAEEPRTADSTVGAGRQASASAYEQASRILRARLEENSVATP
jgi:hypothetical protein